MENYPKVSDKELNRILRETDYGAYEARQTRIEDELNRKVAEMSILPRYLCHLRRCRRSGLCHGPAVPSSHKQDRVRTQRLIGLEGLAFKTLPQCLANLSKQQFEKAYAAAERQITDRHLPATYWAHHRALAKINYGSHLRDMLGIQIGPDLARDIHDAQFEEVMKVVVRDGPPDEPDIPVWIQTLEWVDEADPKKANQLWPRGRLTVRKTR